MQGVACAPAGRLSFFESDQRVLERTGWELDCKDSAAGDCSLKHDAKVFDAQAPRVCHSQLVQHVAAGAATSYMLAKWTAGRQWARSHCSGSYEPPTVSTLTVVLT